MTTKRILLVGAKLSADSLRSAGCQVVQSFSPNDAAECIVREGPFDVVCCDDGFARLEILQLSATVHQSRGRIVLISPNSAEEDGDLAERFAADTVLRVPLRRNAIPRLLKAV
jgi:hypothetical protein